MSVILPELEVIEGNAQSLRYLEHGWPDPLCRWHSHKECELHLILDTHGKAFVGDYIGDFAPRSLFLTGPHLPHNWITDDVWTEPVSHRDMVIQFDHERVQALNTSFPEFHDMHDLIERSRSGLEFFDFDFEWVRQKFSLVRDARGPERILGFLELLSHVARLPSYNSLSVLRLVQPEGNSRQARTAEVIDHIVKNFSEQISLAQAANMAGMTSTSFARNFQSITGNRFVEFVNRVRIGEACGMLYATDEQVTTICYQVGFQNLANFNRHFLKMKGMTPTEYRNTARRELVPEKETTE